MMLLLGAAAELAVLLHSRLLGCRFLSGDCGLLIPGHFPSGIVVSVSSLSLSYRPAW